MVMTSSIFSLASVKTNKQQKQKTQDLYNPHIYPSNMIYNHQIQNGVQSKNVKWLWSPVFSCLRMACLPGHVGCANGHGEIISYVCFTGLFTRGVHFWAKEGTQSQMGAGTQSILWI